MVQPIGLSWVLILHALSAVVPGCKQQQHLHGGRLEQDLLSVCERHLPVVDERPQSRASEHLRSRLSRSHSPGKHERFAPTP